MHAAALHLPPSPVESEVARIRALLERSRFAASLAAAESLRLQVPENRDVWYLIAVSQRYLESLDDALATLARLEELHPRFSRLFQERGHCLRARKDTAGAIDAYLHAVGINAALPASWKALQELCTAAGREADAQAAAGHVAKLASLPAAIVTASSMLSDGEVHAAEQLVRRFLLTHADHIEGMRLLA
ncbi:MAG TPA: hypothetical protein VIX87_02365, partial [Steroidobacteraceae bacterium]